MKPTRRIIFPQEIVAGLVLHMDYPALVHDTRCRITLGHGDGGTKRRPMLCIDVQGETSWWLPLTTKAVTAAGIDRLFIKHEWKIVSRNRGHWKCRNYVRNPAAIVQAVYEAVRQHCTEESKSVCARINETGLSEVYARVRAAHRHRGSSMFLPHVDAEIAAGGAA